jgi:hypothetical protein
MGANKLRKVDSSKKEKNNIISGMREDKERGGVMLIKKNTENVPWDCDHQSST